jgi:hypothetical protein
MKSWQLQFRLHAVQRMYQRGIAARDVRDVIEGGDVIEDYPDDKPYPSCLLLGHVHGRPVHVMLAKDEVNQQGIVVTVYEPDLHLWEADYRRRKTS